MKKSLPILAVCLCIFFGAVSLVLAQDSLSSGMAVSVPIVGSNVSDGEIVCQTTEGTVLCAREYDPQIYGVITLTPSVSFISTGSADLKPVLTDGKAYVYVSSKNGLIRSGDYITSSIEAGVGQKATRSGFVLGVALQDYTNTDVNAKGKILITVQPKPAILTQKASANLIELIKQGIDASYLSPLMALRYIVAAALTIGSVVVGFLFFGKVASNGVTAIGRNPLAKTAIQAGIFLNVLLTIAIMGVGVLLSYLLLTL